MPVTNIAASTNVVAAHNAGVVVLTGASSSTLTVQTNATVALPVGFSVDVLNWSSSSSAVLTIAAAGGVTFVSNNTPPQALNFTQGVRLIKIATDTWWAVRLN